MTTHWFTTEAGAKRTVAQCGLPWNQLPADHNLIISDTPKPGTVTCPGCLGLAPGSIMGHQSDTHWLDALDPGRRPAYGKCGAIAVSVEHNLAANPMAVTCDKCLAKMPERTLSGAVDAVEGRLAILYLARRGRIIDGQEPQDPELGGPCWGWCGGCGKVQVDAGAGNDTCPTCIERS